MEGGGELSPTQMTLADVSAMRPTMVYYGASTCWWGVETRSGGPRYRTPGNGLPADPRGGVLFQTDDFAAFIRSAVEKPEHYGVHGLDAFMAAFEGNVTNGGRSWCFRSWDDYNRLLDERTPPPPDAGGEA